MDKIEEREVGKYYEEVIKKLNWLTQNENDKYYEEVKKPLPKKNTPLEKTKIISKIRKLAKKYNINYIVLLLNFLRNSTDDEMKYYYDNFFKKEWNDFEKFQMKYCYREIKKIISKQGGSYNKTKIIPKIEELARTNFYTPWDVIEKYLYYAIRRNEPDLKNIFYSLFHKEMKADREYLREYLFIYMGIHGLRDISDYERAIRNTLKNGKNRPSYFFNNTDENIYSLSSYNSPVMIIGETGTSKQLVAELIYDISERNDKKFVNVNCVALSEGLFESELFGHKKGAFTGATHDKDGLLKKADKGTFFLDELGKLSLSLQAKLLKVIEEKEFTLVGCVKPIAVDIRFIAAIQPKDKEKLLPDLLYRLGYPDCIELSTLNERLDFAPYAVIKGSIIRAKESMNLRGKFGVHRDAISILTKHRYKGNYRELENILRAALRNAKREERNMILPEDLKIIEEKRELKSQETGVSDSSKTPLEKIKLKDILEYAEKKKAEIVKAKLEEICRSGEKIKCVLKSEGIKTVSEYQTMNNKFKNLLGKDTLKQIRSINNPL